MPQLTCSKCLPTFSLGQTKWQTDRLTAWLTNEQKQLHNPTSHKHPWGVVNESFTTNTMQVAIVYTHCWKLVTSVQYMAYSY